MFRRREDIPHHRILAVMAALLLLSGCARTPEELMAHGNELLAAGDVGGAAIAFGRALKERPDDPELLTRVAGIQRLRGEDQKAMESYRRLLEMVPDRAQDRLALTELQAEAGLWLRVGENLPLLLQALPDEVRVYRLAARAAEQAGEPDRALTLWRRAARRDADDPAIQHAIGRLLQARGEVEAAIQAYQRASRIDPTYTEAQFDLGLLLIEQNRMDEAERAFLRHIDTHPRDPVAYYRLGNALFSKGYERRAIEQYKRALILRPEYAEAWFNLGMAYYGLDRRGEARQAFENAVIWGESDAFKETARRMLRDVNGR
jgi:protein O-GlcNAc transferase